MANEKDEELFTPWVETEGVYALSRFQYFLKRLGFRFHARLLTKDYLLKTTKDSPETIEKYWEILRERGSVRNVLVKYDKDGNIIQYYDKDLGKGGEC